MTASIIFVQGAIAILEKSGLAFVASNLYQERYLAELDAFCKEQERVQREKQKEFKASHPELFGRYPKFSTHDLLNAVWQRAVKHSPSSFCMQKKNRQL